MHSAFISFEQIFEEERGLKLDLCRMAVFKYKLREFHQEDLEVIPDGRREALTVPLDQFK